MLITFQNQNKENWGPMPPKHFPGDRMSYGLNNGMVHASRQSEPIPYPPSYNSFRRPNPYQNGARYSEQHTPQETTSHHQGPLLQDARESNGTVAHQFDYALLQQSSGLTGYPVQSQTHENIHGFNDGQSFSEGRIPTYQEAEQLFNPNDTTNHFNESRLSFGMAPPALPYSHLKDPMYETLSKYSGPNMNRWSNASSSNQELPARMRNIDAFSDHRASRTSIQSVDNGSIDPIELTRKAPPPLPPKPRLGSNRSVHSDIGGVPYQYSSGIADKRPSGIYLSGDEVDIDERGYSVSFV